MADITPTELRRAIEAAGHTWRVRDVPPDEKHGLGDLGIDPAVAQRALERGSKFAESLGIADDSAAVARRPPLPRDFDWRSRGVIGAVRDQGGCGSCVSFATTGVVAAMAAIEGGLPQLHLSEADSHFCSSHGADCDGWNNADALSEMEDRGVVVDAAFPYSTAFSNGAARCRRTPDRERHCYRVADYFAPGISPDIRDSRKRMLVAHGPMVVSFTVFEDFDSYGGGVYRHVRGEKRGGHAVLLVGYTDDEQAWICRNSWGARWAGPADPDGTGAGFFKIGYGECDIDNNPFLGVRGVTPIRQGLWRWCNKCKSLAYTGDAAGACAAGGTHEHAGSGQYFVVMDSPRYPGQSNWRWCNKCFVLAFAGESSLGACAAGGVHDHGGSADYFVPEGPEPAAQSGWQWCNKCQNLHFAQDGQGICAASGDHDPSGSADYTLAIV